MGEEAAGAAVGARVRALRSERGWSMRELATRAGVSQPFVSKLEGGRMLPSVPTLYALAAALGTTPGALLPPPGGREAQGDVHLPLTDAPGAAPVRVVSGGPDGAVQVYLIELAAGEADGGFPAHGGDEVLVVLDGAVVSSEQGRAEVEVVAGGSRTVDAAVPHGLRAAPGAPARCLLVCTHRPPG